MRSWFYPILFLASIILAVSNHTANAEGVPSGFLEFQDGVAGWTLTPLEAVPAASALLVAVTGTPDERNYWISRIEVLRGESLFMAGNRAGAEAAFEASRAAAEKALVFRTWSEGVRALAEAKTQLMLLRGFPGIIGEAPNVDAETDRALSLDPGNPKALILKAYGKINAPPLFGGNPSYAVTVLKSAASGRALETLDRFLIAYGLAQAYDKLGKRLESRAALADALLIYPKSKQALEFKKRLGS